MRPARGEADPLRLKWLAARLEEAGATLLALPQRGAGPKLRQARWATAMSESEESAPATRRLRPAIPGPADISRMDEAFAWVGLIPDDRLILRRIVHARSLVSPLTGRHIYSWRRLGDLLGADHKAVQRWHLDGLKLILRKLDS